MSYAKAKIDPFSMNDNDLPCIPDVIDIPSYKFATVYRGGFIVGSSNIGWIGVAPKALSNDGRYIVVTTSSYAGTDFTPSSTLPTGALELKDTKFPWASNAPRNCRVVACALRVRYTGTELNRGGSIIAVPNNSRANYNSATYAMLSNLPTSSISPVTRGWTSILWNSAIYGDYQYQGDAGENMTSGAEHAGLICMVTGTPGNTFEFEVIRYIEATDNGAGSSPFTVPSTTMSHSDPVGLGVVKDFLSNQTVQEVGTAALNKFLKFAKNGAAAYASSYFGAGPLLLTL